MANLAANWDTLGWVYYRRDDFEQAVRYLRAAWKLSLSTTIGDHLGQVYERQGKRHEATHQYRLTMASGGLRPEPDRDHSRQRYETLVRSEPPLHWRAGDPPPLAPEQELLRTRTVKLSTRTHDQGSASFLVVFSPEKIEDVKYVSGDDNLKSMADRIAKSKFDAEFPTPRPMLLIRRGTLRCGQSGCEFVLQLLGEAAKNE